MSYLDHSKKIIEQYGSRIRFDPTTKKWWLYQDTGFWKKVINQEMNTTILEWILMPFEERHEALMDAFLQMEDSKQMEANKLARTNLQKIMGKIEDPTYQDKIRKLLEGNNLIHREFKGDNPMCLILENGCLNLKTAQLHSITDTVPSLYMENKLPYHLYNWSDKEEEWNNSSFKKFLDYLFPDKAVNDWVGMVFSSCLSGNRYSRDFYFLTGVTKGGKSSLLDTIAEVLGGYSRKCRASLFDKTVRDKFKASPLMGMRMVYASEFPKRNLDEEFIKEVTGDDKTEIERKGIDSEEIRLYCKLFIASNELPRARFDDDALWNRIKPIKFTKEYKSEHDPKIAFRKERELIFNWLVHMFKRMLSENKNLTPPQSITSDTKAVQEANDYLHEFKKDKLVFTRDETDRLKSADVYKAVCSWFLRQEGEIPRYINEKAVSQNLQKSGAEKGKYSVDGKVSNAYKFLRWAD
jgi:P4 family phage/plasmid primase-like protien